MLLFIWNTMMFLIGFTTGILILTVWIDAGKSAIYRRRRAR